IGELTGLSFAAAFIDLDHDGWPDLYEAVDKAFPNRVLRNNGDGTFVDIGVSSGGDIGRGFSPTNVPIIKPVARHPKAIAAIMPIAIAKRSSTVI
ncbi:MAG: VCBS repeat-containing protein, partial [Pseudomonadota bacterium]